MRSIVESNATDAINGMFLFERHKLSHRMSSSGAGNDPILPPPDHLTPTRARTVSRHELLWVCKVLRYMVKPWWSHQWKNLTRTNWKIEWELYWNYWNIPSLLYTEFFSPNHGSCRNSSNSDAVPARRNRAIVCWARPITSYGGCWGFCLFPPQVHLMMAMFGP